MKGLVVLQARSRKHDVNYSSWQRRHDGSANALPARRCVLISPTRTLTGASETSCVTALQGFVLWKSVVFMDLSLMYIGAHPKSPSWKLLCLAAAGKLSYTRPIF